MDCEECARLRAEHDRLNKAYIAAHEATAAGPLKPFVRLRTVSNEAWLDAETARFELQRHERGHRMAN